MSNEHQSPFGALITAMVTPFKSNGDVDYNRAEALTRHLLEHGSSGIVVAGTTGESPTLTPDEKLELFRVVKRAAGNASVIANTGDNETAFSIEFSRRASECGIDGLLLVVPYYNRPNQEGLYRHFKAIADEVELPCLLYNIPSRTGRNLEPATMARLREVKNIIGVKEASGDMGQVSKVRALAGADYLIYSGNDGDTLPMLPLGACGCISVISHIAGVEYAEMMAAYWRGDAERALELHLRLLPVCDALFPSTASNPIAVKAGLQLQDFDCGGLRLPMVEASDGERRDLSQAMRKAGLLPVA